MKDEHFQVQRQIVKYWNPSRRNKHDTN